MRETTKVNANIMNKISLICRLAGKTRQLHERTPKQGLVIAVADTYRIDFHVIHDLSKVKKRIGL